MAVCDTCGNNTLSVGEWYCNYCGNLRNQCAISGCSGEITERSCTNCGAVPEAPCRHCEEWIPADVSKCPECGQDWEEAGSFGALGVLGLPMIILGIAAILIGYFIFPIWFNIFTLFPLGLLSILIGVVFGGVLTVGGLIGDQVADKEHAASIQSAELQRETDEWAQIRDAEVKEMAGAAASAVGSAAESYSEHKEEKERRQQEKEKERQRQQKNNKRKQMESKANELISEGEKSHTLLTVLWNMNCPRCGIQWVTSHQGKLVRSDEFNTTNFKIVNEEEYSYIQDRVRIQCEAPDCNHTEKFTKDSLW